MIKGNPKSYIPKDWEITKNRYVGFIDIMGFRDMVLKKTSNDIYAMMERLHKVITTNVSGFGEDHVIDEEGQQQDNLIVTIATFSDSILIYSKDDSESCFDNFVLTVASLCEDLFSEKIAYRGAVACGEMTLDFKKSIYFGQPFIDVYMMEQELSFYGIVCHGTFEAKIIEFSGLSCHEYLVTYDCPFKTGTANHYVIRPMSITGASDTISKVNSFRLETSGPIRQYVDNTLKYLIAITS